MVSTMVFVKSLGGTQFKIIYTYPHTKMYERFSKFAVVTLPIGMATIFHLSPSLLQGLDFLMLVD